MTGDVGKMESSERVTCFYGAAFERWVELEIHWRRLKS